MAELVIRPLAVDDAAAVARIFFCAVHEGTREHYSYTQRLAWGGEEVSPDAWRARLEGVTGFVAELEGEPVGFMTIEASGYIDFAFVLPSMAGAGVGFRLYEAVETKARAFEARELTTNASKPARPFFQRQGWEVVTEQIVERQGVRLTNYKMRKAL